MVSPTVETAIWLALKARVLSMVLTPVIPVERISMPNEAFTPPGVGVSYLKVEHIPNRVLRPFIGSTGPHHYRGILQISLRTTLNQSVTVATEIAGDIADHFPCDDLLTAYGVSLRITKSPDVGRPMEEATHLHTPVSIDYEVYQ